MKNNTSNLTIIPIGFTPPFNIYMKEQDNTIVQRLFHEVKDNHLCKQTNKNVEITKKQA